MTTFKELFDKIYSTSEKDGPPKDNLDLPPEFIEGVREAREQMKAGQVKPYVRRTKRKCD